MNRRNRKHGHYDDGRRSPTVITWIKMRHRCNNQKSPQYAYYGGRGITVCVRWDNFANFLADMGERPAGLTLDRINNNGNYEPSNCRWATRREQQQNTRKARSCEVNGKVYRTISAAIYQVLRTPRTVYELADILGISCRLARTHLYGQKKQGRVVRTDTFLWQAR